MQERDPRSVMGTAVRDDFGQLEASAGWIDPGLNFRRRRIQASQVDSSLAPLAVDWLSGCSLILCPTAHQPPARFDPGIRCITKIWISAAGWQPAVLLCCGYPRRNWGISGRRQPHTFQPAPTPVHPQLLPLPPSALCPLGSSCAVTAFVLTALLRLPLQPRRGWAVLSGIRVAG